MEDRENRYVAQDVKKLVWKRAQRIAREHGGCPEVLCIDDAWHEVIADMSRRELNPWEYVEAIKAEQEVSHADA